MDQEMTFEQQMLRLNELVANLEKNETPLEESILSFEEGLKLVKELETKLQQYEDRVNSLIKGSESNVK